MDEVTRVIDFIARDQINGAQALALVSALGDGLHRTKSSLALVDPQLKLQRWYTAALNTAIDASASEAARLEAEHLLGVGPYKFTDIGDWLLLICTPPPAPALQSVAITALGRYEDPVVVQGLLERWQGLTPAVRNHAVTVLLSRESRVPAVLDAIASRRIPVTDLSGWHLDFLRTYRDPAIGQRAVQLLGPVPVRRPEAENQFRPALRLHGGSDHGREIFRARCSECHQFGSRGRAFGPDLTGTRTTSRDQILSAILEPNLKVSPEYATWIVQSKEGEILIGIKKDDDLPTITLAQPGGKQLVWPRLNVRSAETVSWSLMPDGLEQGLSTQDMADLLEYLMTGAK
jgi:putative heme-binding domain-containing protein